MTSSHRADARPAALLLAVLLFLGVVLTAVVSMAGVLPADVTIARWLQQAQTIQGFVPVMVLVSAPGYSPWTFILWGSAVLLLLLRRAWVAAVLVALTALAGGLAELLKLIVARPRPTADLVEVYRAVSGYSFPSGHVVHYVTFFGIIGYLAWRRLRGSPPPTSAVRLALQLLVAVCCVLIVLVGLSRVFLGAHWPSDVIGGYVLGSICWIVLVLIETRLRGMTWH